MRQFEDYTDHALYNNSSSWEDQYWSSDAVLTLEGGWVDRVQTEAILRLCKQEFVY